MRSPAEMSASIRRRAVHADLLWAVGELFRRWLAEQSGGRMEGAPRELMEMELGPEDVDGLHDALTWFVRDDFTHPEAGLAIWAIGKLAREGDEALFREALEEGLKGDDNLLYQAIIALDNLEALPMAVESFSAFDTEANRRIGQAYLDHRGVVPSPPELEDPS